MFPAFEIFVARSNPLATSSIYRIGTITMLTLVALRLAVGWHFYREGADKIIAGDWSSAGFMVIAKGPLTPFYHWLLWDGDGRARLDQPGTHEAWDNFRQRVVKHYRFDEKQAEQAQIVFDTRRDQLDEFFAENQEEIAMYFKGLERRDKYRRSAERREVSSLRGQAEQIEQELKVKAGPWLAALDRMWEEYERDMNALATPEQAQRGKLALKRPGRKLLDTVFIDQVIPTFDLVVGILLIVGLFTRIVSLAGAGFLAGIILTQWPGAPGALPTYYQVIEMFALLVLAATGAGRFAGLDFFTSLLWRRCCLSKTEKV